MTAHAGMGSFHRVGPPVTAQRSAVAVQWTSSTGDVLHGEPGDWIITDANGAVRTIKDAQFRMSYRHVAGDQWQRVGTVRAERVGVETEIHTLEGVATARAGDWIVTSADGARWPVPDDEFRAGYVPDDGTWDRPTNGEGAR